VLCSRNKHTLVAAVSSRSLPAFFSDMAPYYEALCKSLEWQIDTDLLNKMKKANEEELKRLDNELEDAEKILGESEIRDAMMAKAEYLCRIGDKVGLWQRLQGLILKTLHRNPLSWAGSSECCSQGGSWATLSVFSL